ncbi:MAG TPA: ATP-binding protein, partial [Candidatus Angelobacter sp.]|nr:ATP-binding protein [Candidatus Angelobacter sp.]
TGPGISSEDRPRLFGVFEQFHRGPERMDAGSGLGLHLSQRIAGLLGGRIEAESEPGNGSVFTLFLPER